MYCCQLSRLPVPNLHRLQNQHRFTRNETLIWNFIGTFFKNIFNGCRDYVNMVPDKITLATANVKLKTNFLTKLGLGH